MDKNWFLELTPSFSQTHRFSGAHVPASSKLFKIKRYSQKEQLGAYVRLDPSEKPEKVKVAFEQSKGGFRLDRTAQAQIDAAFGSDTLRCLFPLLPEDLLLAQLRGLSGIWGPIAPVAAGTVSAVHVAVLPGGGDKLTLPLHRTFSLQSKFSALGTSFSRS